MSSSVSLGREPATGLTIGAVAARTGLTVPVLRAWEDRHGFPRPARLVGGHRRYTDDDVARILRVVEERASGRSLATAIELARRLPQAAPDVTLDDTVYAGLRRHRPELEAHVVSRRTMLAISNAIEDECLAHADRATLTAAFQHADAYVLAFGRWRSLARQATSAVVFADFERSRTSATGVHEIAIPPEAALEREWSVVCDGPRAGAVLAGWERADGRFEAVWSVEPDVVRIATGIGRELAQRWAPGLEVPSAPDHHLDAATGLRRATAITNRIVGYLDRLAV